MAKCSLGKPFASSNVQVDEVNGESTKPQLFAPTLPVELILLIFESVAPSLSRAQPTLSRMCLVCRSWYAALVCPLYNSGHICQSRFRRFVETICSPVHARAPRNGLADHIYILDLAFLLDMGGKALTKRLLGRLRFSLKTFVAPRLSSFS